jgi:CheY-like chemotaxis protein
LRIRLSLTDAPDHGLQGPKPAKIFPVIPQTPESPSASSEITGTSLVERSHPIRVLIVDDNHGIRAALVKLLNTAPDMQVVGLAVDGEEAVVLAAALVPDVVLMDMSMPALDGVEATRRIVEQNPGLRVVTLTAFRTRQEEARRAGAVAHVLKDAPPDELIGCIRRVVASSPLESGWPAS